VQSPGSLGHEVEHVAVAGLYFGCPGIACGELAVDVGEELGQFAGAGPGGHDALLVVAELGPDQFQVAFGLVLVDLGEQFGLRAARAGGVAFRSCDGDMFQVQFRGEDAAGPVSELDRQSSAQGTEADRVVRDGGEAEPLAGGAVDLVPEPGPADVERKPA
jgi:hypothetical protein